jgi:anaerobic magnesium-protoporphyrin IX monomethyl ester cyclase
MIVLFNPWSTPSRKTPLPMSILALASVLEGEIDYVMVDGNLTPDPVAAILEHARRRPLTAIAVTVMPGPQLVQAVAASRRLKRALPDVPIVWGGYFPTQHAEACLRDSAVDLCVLGQGEATFRELVAVLARGGSLAGVAGLAYREGGRIARTAPRPLVALDGLPDWPYARLPMARYLHRHYLGARVTAHHSSFGCPFACAFCAVVAMANRRWVAQSPARVAAILARQQADYGIDAVQFHDMDFFIAEARAAEIADRLVPLGLAWWALGRVDELLRYRDDTWRRLKASGLKMVFCGAESGSDEVLARMNKGGTARAALTLELARRLRDYAIVPEFSFVVGNPPDPVEDTEVTLRFVRQVKAVNPAAEIVLYTYAPVPADGPLAREAEALGFRFPETLDAWVSAPWRDFALRRDPKTPWLAPNWLARVRNFERVLNAYYPTVTDPRLTPAKRTLLRWLSGWRYRFECYGWPIELRVCHRIFHYQRPETTGF